MLQRHWRFGPAPDMSLRLDVRLRIYRTTQAEGSLRLTFFGSGLSVAAAHLVKDLVKDPTS